MEDTKDIIKALSMIDESILMLCSLNVKTEGWSDIIHKTDKAHKNVFGWMIEDSEQ